MKKFALDVRDFAVPVPRTGSIEANSGYALLPASGQEAHARAQRLRKESISSYRTEVKTAHTFERGDYQFAVSGRIDGIYDDPTAHLEEIKTTFNLEDLIERLNCDPIHPYALQLKTYAYIFHLDNGFVPKSTFYLVSIQSGESHTIDITLDVAEYEVWMDKRLDELVQETKIREADEKRRKKLSAKLAFPFDDPRPGQEELIAALEKNLESNNAMLVQAPTGLGKTVGVMYPALKEALSRGQRLIYLTPKNSQQAVAQDAVFQFQKEKCNVKALTLKAKAKVCMKEEPICDPTVCEFAKDYYTKMHANDIVNKVAKESTLDADTFRRYAEKYEVCPFELSIDTIQRADVVIGDYNHVFAPRSLLGRLSAPAIKKSERPNLVIDEVHNLPQRATDYYSPALFMSSLVKIREEIREQALPLAQEACDMIARCISTFGRYRPNSAAREIRVEIDRNLFVRQDEEIKEFLSRYLAIAAVKARDPVIRLSQEWGEFTAALSYEGEQFFSTYRRRGQEEILKITCCDASEMLKPHHDQFANVIGFSATVKPFRYYAQLSGLDPDTTETIELTSPFPKTNRKLLVIPQVSTKLKDRESNFGKISDAIKRIVKVRAGNYFVFFPSFDFLEKVAEITAIDGFRVLQQRRDITYKEINEYLEMLRSNDEPTILFAVQGGVFSEGVDYPGDMLIGAIIVGPALPTFDLEREILRSYYDKSYGSGFDYAYTYPAMAKVIQSAGRVIRSQHERGLIVLMDQRFTAPSYVRTMPSDWFDSSVNELVSRSILKDIKDFWEKA
jgi:DNA excision repair protein ERCC-2